MQNKLLSNLKAATENVKLPNPRDIRGELATNPSGRKWRNRDVSELKGMVWHQELGWGTVEDVAEYHTGPKSHLTDGGVESISYTFAIRRNGQIVLCNDLEKSTWSQGYKARVGDENAEFLSVMYEGHFNSVHHVTNNVAGEPTGDQILAGMVLWQQCKKIWQWNSNDLYGHYHFGKPACPGTTLQMIIDYVRTTRPLIPTPKIDFTLNCSTSRQSALKHLGFYRSKVDGIWGPGSIGAVTKFQDAHGLYSDGLWGPQTEKAIVNELNIANPFDI